MFRSLSSVVFSRLRPFASRKSRLGEFGETGSFRDVFGRIPLYLFAVTEESTHNPIKGRVSSEAAGGEDALMIKRGGRVLYHEQQRGSTTELRSVRRCDPLVVVVECVKSPGSRGSAVMVR
jgi:hypothetical protein